MASNIIFAESHVLRCAKAEIEAVLGIGQYASAVPTETLVRIDQDEYAPPPAAITHIVVTSGGITPGPKHSPSGGVWDFVYAVDVIVMRRVTNVPKDRAADPWLYLADSLNTFVEAVLSALDWSEGWLERINTMLVSESANLNEQPFLKYLTFEGIDAKPQTVPGSVFGCDEREPRAGIKRKIRFGGARRVTYKS